VEQFQGYHSEWNLGSPGGWDYQKTTQIIGKSIWQKLNRIKQFKVELDFEHPFFFPVDGFAEMLIAAHKAREGGNPGLIAVVAEEETLEDVTENRNLAQRLSAVDGITGALMAPQELELNQGEVCWKNQPVSILFMDFNTDLTAKLSSERPGRVSFIPAKPRGPTAIELMISSTGRGATGMPWCSNRKGATPDTGCGSVR
jgi:hypothetical protein